MKTIGSLFVVVALVVVSACSHEERANTKDVDLGRHWIAPTDYNLGGGGNGGGRARSNCETFGTCPVANGDPIYPDLSTPVDMTMVASDDLSAPADMSVGPDMTTPTDLSTVPVACDYGLDCSWSFGYWKQHWACSVNDLALGTTHYTHDQLSAILNQSVNGNELVDLAHQLIGAKMNVIKGANPSTIQATIDASDALIGALVVPPIGTDSLTMADVGSLPNTLEAFNLGNLGPAHCQ